MELHAQAQVDELNQREAQFQEEWMFLQQECAKITKDKDMMMIDLIACQDMIHEESQASQQYRRQLLGQQSLPRLVDEPRAHRERSELWAVGAGDAVDYRDDGRALRQPTVAGNAHDGGRLPRDVDSGYGHPVGSAVGRSVHESFFSAGRQRRQAV